MPENVEANPVTSWNPESKHPEISETAYIHPQATVIGAVSIGEKVMVAPYASVRGDEGLDIRIDDHSNVQDAVILHGRQTIDQNGNPIKENQVEVDGENYSIYIGKRVSLAHQAQVHGPAIVFDNVFVGMQTFVYKATIGKNSVLEPKACVIGANVPENRYVPSGVVITSQEDADALPEIYEGYPFRHTNDEVVEVNVELADGYNQRK
ncbi:carbonic anhydrase [Methanococcoides sp. LMO-2]|uniref:Carbonic anhydrase n=1 Tax=Methanococcoides cohabitans TaxID=3136559 RepID=A0ABU9KXC4_9EURY